MSFEYTNFKILTVLVSVELDDKWMWREIRVTVC